MFVDGKIIINLNALFVRSEETNESRNYSKDLFNFKKKTTSFSSQESFKYYRKLYRVLLNSLSF